jgi:hypothetical protein
MHIRQIEKKKENYLKKTGNGKKRNSPENTSF